MSKLVEIMPTFFHGTKINEMGWWREGRLLGWGGGEGCDIVMMHLFTCRFLKFMNLLTK